MHKNGVFSGVLRLGFLVFLTVLLLLVPISAREYIIEHNDEVSQMQDLREQRSERWDQGYDSSYGFGNAGYDAYGDDALREELEYNSVALRNLGREYQQLRDDLNDVPNDIPSQCRGLIEDRMFRSFYRYNYAPYGGYADYSDLEDLYLYDRDCWSYFGRYGLPYVNMPYTWWQNSNVWYRDDFRYGNEDRYRNDGRYDNNGYYYGGYGGLYDDIHRAFRYHPLNDPYRNCVYYADPVMHRRCIDLNYPPRQDGNYGFYDGDVGDREYDPAVYRSWQRSCNEQASRNNGILNDWCVRTREFWDRPQ